MQDILIRAKKVRLAIFDVDGVMTDGSLFLSNSGDETKAFNIQDGLGMKMLSDSGVTLAIISGRTSKIVECRARDLGIAHLYQGVSDKLVAYRDLLSKMKLEPAETAYMGDDLVDLPVLKRCGIAFCVPEAPEAVKRHSHYVSRRHGGHGAVREVCELLLQLQGNFEAQLAHYE